MSDMLFIGAQRLEPATDEGQLALGNVHGTASPVTCNCVRGGVPMYVARVEDRYIVKRMPGTGLRHAPSCVSFEPPEHLSGLSELQGTAISESPEDGEVTLKLDFALTKTGKRALPPLKGDGAATEAIGSPKKLGLTALLHFLWQESELTKWVPAMEGKRWWGPVRSALMRAALGKTAKGLELKDVLYVPEVYKQDTYVEAKGRRAVKLAAIAQRGGSGTSLGLIIAEYKSHEPTRLGSKFTFKHSPGFSFFADADLTKRFERVFEDQLNLASIIPDTKIMVIASFIIAKAGYPVLEQIGMMLVDANWLPFEHMREVDVIEAAVAQKRRFVKQLRYNLKYSSVISTLVLHDTDPAVALFVAPPTAGFEAQEDFCALAEDTEFATWIWSSEPVMPTLPPRPQNADGRVV